MAARVHGGLPYARRLAPDRFPQAVHVDGRDGRAVGRHRAEPRGRQDAPSNKLDLAAVGIGGMGASNLKACADENIVALCDVDRGYAARSSRPTRRRSSTSTIARCSRRSTGIDGVIIATPDHTHAAITMAVLRAGKHVYRQKPLTHTLFEARAVTEAARKHKVVTQMGNQGQSYDSMRLLKEWLDDGAIGDVTEVHAWTDRPVGGDPWSDFEGTGTAEGHAAGTGDARLEPVARAGRLPAVTTRPITR